MAKSTHSKWIIGLTGTALSAFVLSQIGSNPNVQGAQEAETIITKRMSEEEKQLVLLDWSNFSINGSIVTEGVVQSDRQTRKS